MSSFPVLERLSEIEVKMEELRSAVGGLRTLVALGVTDPLAEMERDWEEPDDLDNLFRQTREALGIPQEAKPVMSLEELRAAMSQNSPEPNALSRDIIRMRGE